MEAISSVGILKRIKEAGHQFQQALTTLPCLIKIVENKSKIKVLLLKFHTLYFQ